MSDDAERFTAVYDACRQRVWAYVVARGGRRVADEVVSETFTIAWRRFAEVPDDPLPWLLGTARNILRSATRAQVRRESFAAEALHWTREAAGDPAEDVTERIAVIHALATLSDQDRELLVLVAWQGLDARDAARVLGCSAATARVCLHRARRRLAAAIEPGPPLPAVATTGRKEPS